MSCDVGNAGAEHGIAVLTIENNRPNCPLSEALTKEVARRKSGRNAGNVDVPFAKIVVVRFVVIAGVVQCSDADEPSADQHVVIGASGFHGSIT